MQSGFFYTLVLSSKERREGLKALRVWCKAAGTGERTAAFGPVPYICMIYACDSQMWMERKNRTEFCGNLCRRWARRRTVRAEDRMESSHFLLIPVKNVRRVFYCRFFGHCILCSENRRRAGRVLQPKKESLERGAEGKKRCNGFHFPIRTTAWLFFKSWFVRSTGLISLLFLFVLKNACVFNSNTSIK